MERAHCHALRIGIPALALTHNPTPSEPAKCSGTVTQLPAVCSFPLILPTEGKVDGGSSRVEPTSCSHQEQAFVTLCDVWMSMFLKDLILFTPCCFVLWFVFFLRHAVTLGKQLAYSELSAPKTLPGSCLILAHCPI